MGATAGEHHRDDTRGRALARAESALIDLAAAMRGWNPDDLEQALWAAKQAGWDFEQRTFPYVVRLLRAEDGTPTGLRHAAASPFGRIPDEPEDAVAAGQRGYALARHLLEHRNDDSLGETA